MLFEEHHTFRIMSHENYGFFAHFHSAFEIYYIRTGAMRARINGRDIETSAGDMFVCNPMEVHFYLESRETTDVYSLIVSDDYLGDVYAAYPRLRLPNHLPDKTYNLRVRDLLELLLAADRRTVLSPLAKKGYANLVFDAIVNRYGYANEKLLNENIGKILEYIHKNYQEDLSLKSLSHIFGYSETSFSRLFSKYVDMDLRRYVNKLRVRAADEMLRDPECANLSVLDISLRCGFNSQATFYRAYKLYHETLPRMTTPPPSANAENKNAQP